MGLTTAVFAEQLKSRLEYLGLSRFKATPIHLGDRDGCEVRIVHVIPLTFRQMRDTDLIEAFYKSMTSLEQEILASPCVSALQKRIANLEAENKNLIRYKHFHDLLKKSVGHTDDSEA